MRGWNNYFFMVGTAAASLIGLMFVVVTLTAGRDRTELEAGKKLYTTPIVWHLAVVLTISGASVAPAITLRWFGVGTIIVGAVGLGYSIYIALGIIRAELASNFSGYDAAWYGFTPALIYVGIGLCGLSFVKQAPSAPTGLAGAVMALLLVSIHNEWDLVTYLAPDATTAAGGTGNESGSG